MRRSAVVLLVTVMVGHSHCQSCSTGVGGNLVISGPATLDTDTGVINPPGGVSPAYDGAAFNFVDIDIQVAGTLRARGSQPLVLLATGSVTVDGVIDISGQPGGDVLGTCNEPGGAGGAGGPGGFGGGAGGGLAPGSGLNDGDAGGGTGGGGGGIDLSDANGSGGCGGGGGHATPGTAGGVRGAGMGGAGGVTYPSLPALIGGGGGGGASTDDDTAPVGPPVDPGDDGGAGGGGGGGCVQIIASTLTVNGMIDARGGAGGNGNTCNFSGPGGGGAGGSIELLAVVMPAGGGMLDVRGAPGGTHASGPERGGDGGDGRTSIGLISCTPLPTCSLITAGGVLSGDIVLDIDTASPSAAIVDIIFDFSLDGGVTWSTCLAAIGSPLGNPAFATPTGMGSFLWDSRADGVGTAVIDIGVLVRASVDDGVAPVPGTCTTLPFDVDNTMLCTSTCGDCNLSTTGPDILDALTGAQIAAGLIMPTPEQAACCDVDASGTVTVLDSLVIAQSAAGLSVILVCL